MLNQLEATIQKLIAESSTAIAKQIAQAIRQSLAAEIVGPHAATATAAPGSAVAPRKIGRPPGSKNKPAANKTADAPVHAAPAHATTKPERKSFKRRTITQ